MARNDQTAVDDLDTHGARLRIPRSRGALSGLLLLLLGAWGALAPLLGPLVHAGYTPDTAWHLSSGRFWLEILPGVVTAIGGLLLLVGANRITTSFGGWLAVAGGAWFIVGPTLRALLHIGTVGAPIHHSHLGAALETLLLFTGLGALILFLASAAVGRLAIVGIRDVKAAHRRAVADAPPERTVRETPAEPAPVQQVPVQQVPVQQTRVEQVPVEQARVERTRVDHTPVDSSIDDDSFRNTSSGDTAFDSRDADPVVTQDNDGGRTDGDVLDSTETTQTGRSPEPPTRGGGASRIRR